MENENLSSNKPAELDSLRLMVLIALFILMIATIFLLNSNNPEDGKVRGVEDSNSQQEATVN